MSAVLRNMTSLYLSRGGNILMLYRKGGKVVNDVWVGSAGGHFEKDELCDAEACVLRELKEELGVEKHELENLSLRYITLRNMGHEIRQNYYFFAWLKDDVQRALASTEGELRWVPFSELASLPMPFTAKYVVAHYLEIGRQNDTMYVGVANEEDVVFTEFHET